MTAPAAAPTAPWRSRITGSGTEDPNQLLANPKNWRIHPKGQQAALGSVLDEVGWVQEVLVNRTTGHVVDGHLRVELAISRGEPSVPVSYIELTEEEEALVLASLDPLAAMAVTDEAKLAELLDDVAVDSDDLADYLASLLKPASGEGLTDPDDVPEPTDQPYVKAGELWLLGDHRLLCGDATNDGDVARLLDGAEPRLMVTDPPYGVSYDPSWRARLEPEANHREGQVANDDRADWSDAWTLSPASVGYVWHGGLHAGMVMTSLTAAGYEARAQIIWVKQSLVMGRGAYHWQHEPCWFVVKAGATAEWTGDRKQSTVWEISNVHPTQGTSDDLITDHGTQKPVEAMARPMRNHKGDVYDPFLGSGTSLIAAEQLGRRCYGMDIDPVYAQMAIERWQAFTGQEATCG